MVGILRGSQDPFSDSFLSLLTQPPYQEPLLHALHDLGFVLFYHVKEEHGNVIHFPLPRIQDGDLAVHDMEPSDEGRQMERPSFSGVPTVRSEDDMFVHYTCASRDGEVKWKLRVNRYGRSGRKCPLRSKQGIRLRVSSKIDQFFQSHWRRIVGL